MRLGNHFHSGYKYGLDITLTNAIQLCSLNTQTGVRDSRGYHSLLACHEVIHVSFYI